MRIFTISLILILLSLFSRNSLADKKYQFLHAPAEVICWSENKLIFHKTVEAVFQDDENIYLVDKIFTYVIYNCDCVIKYKIKDLNVNKNHK